MTQFIHLSSGGVDTIRNVSSRNTLRGFVLKGRITRLATCGLAISALAACTTVDDYRPVRKDGREFVAGAPVVAKGVFEELRVTGKNGAVQTMAAGGGDLANVASGTSLASAVGGGSSLGGGAALGVAGALLGAISAINAPRIEFMVRRDPEGDLVNVPIAQDYVRQIERMHCISLGDTVRVVKRGGRFDIYNAQPELVRVSDFQPSCRDLKAKAATMTASGTAAGAQSAPNGPAR